MVRLLPPLVTTTHDQSLSIESILDGDGENNRALCGVCIRKCAQTRMRMCIHVWRCTCSRESAYTARVSAASWWWQSLQRVVPSLRAHTRPCAHCEQSARGFASLHFTQVQLPFGVATDVVRHVLHLRHGCAHSYCEMYSPLGKALPQSLQGLASVASASAALQVLHLRALCIHSQCEVYACRLWSRPQTLHDFDSALRAMQSRHVPCLPRHAVRPHSPGVK